MSDEVGDFGFVIQLQSVMSNPSEAGQLRQRLRQALVVAMKARDSMATTALRTTLGAIDNAEAVDISDRPTPKGGPIAGAVVGLEPVRLPGESSPRNRSAPSSRARWRIESRPQPTTSGSADMMKRPVCAPNQPL